MLSLGAPPEWANEAALRACWAVGCVLQVHFTATIYTRWLFAVEGGHLGNASPPYLLATVGWFLLCALGQMTDLHAA